MRWLGALAIAVLLGVMTARPSEAQAQECATPVTSWQTSSTLKATASGVACTGGTCNVNQSAAQAGAIKAGTSSCTSLLWVGVLPTSVSLADSITTPCLTGGGNLVETLGQPTNPTGETILTLDLSANTYSLEADAESSMTMAISGCGEGSSQPSSYIYVPASNWPQKLSLPATVQPLTSSTTFTALTPDAFAPATWTYAFTLIPRFSEDDDCDAAGGSTIGCQNLRLGEDVPIAGTRFNLHYASDRAAIGLGDPVASSDASMIGGWTLSVHHAYNASTNTLFLGDGRQRSAYQLGVPLTVNGQYLLASADGSEIYVFDTTTGRHVATRRPLTGATEYSFGYDGSGRLATVTDASGNVTTIHRDASGFPTSIVAPFGQTTILALDANKLLSKITDPLGHSDSLVNAANGLITSRTDRNGQVYHYAYSSAGRLSKDTDPIGGFTQLSRTDSTTNLSYTAVRKTALGATSTYKNTITASWVQDGAKPYSEQHTNTWRSGLRATSSTSLHANRLSRNVTLPTGTSMSSVTGADPVWGLQVPVALSGSDTEGSLTALFTGSRTATLGTAGNPFTLVSETDNQSINSRLTRTSFTSSNRTIVATSPAGRKVTTVLDALERTASIQVGGRLATTFAYDGHGRLISTAQGSRQTGYSYNADGLVASTTDSLGRQTTFTYDAVGQLVSATLPGAATIAYGYDGEGNVTLHKPTGRPAHRFAYSAVGQPISYTPPVVTGTGATLYTYDLDRNLTKITRPDGETIVYGYDAADRLVSATFPTATVSLAYDAATGHIATVANGSETVAYAYAGRLPTASTWSGAVAGSIARTFSNDFFVTAQTVDGGNSVTFAYDKDGLTIQAGALTIQRRASDGLISGTTLGVTTDSRTYDGFGELSSYTASVNGSPIWSIAYTRDAGGRITQRSETISGASHTDAYSYDAVGRLIKVTKNGTTDSYTYDPNSNRLSGTLNGIASTGTYDAQDRLLTYGVSSYAYSANGELTRRTAAGQTTSYSYDVLGNLIGVTLPGASIAYVVDGENRRVGKKVNGVLQNGFLYDGDAVLAQLNGANGVMRRFVYGTRAITPDYLIAGVTPYRIFSDERGSPVLVVNATTGGIAERITYDEFGNVLADTSPGVQPFRFAGGLYDVDTGLVRFGARDYDPSVGRWTTKDPIRFNGGAMNLYEYGLGDPVNTIDPSGLYSLEEACYDAAKKIEETTDKIIDRIKKIIRDKTATVSLGPVDVHTGRPAISTTAEVDVTVDGQKVASADATVEVGVTPSNNPRDPLIYIDAEGNLKVLKWVVPLFKTHKEFGDPNTWWGVGMGTDVRDGKLEKALCNDAGDGCGQ